MTDFIWLAPKSLWLLTLPIFWLIVSFYHHKKKRVELAKFSQAKIVIRWQKWPNGFMFICLTFLALALARPAWNPQPENVTGKGRDIIFLLDVSRSMLAADARPNRLEVARHAMLQAVNSNENDRFGLVAFAGAASILSPLTNDHNFFKNLLTNLNSDSVPQGGTRIEDALFKVIDKMIGKEDEAAAVDLILISDGEDLGSQPKRALDNLNDLGIRLIVIGLGDSKFGARVPSRDGKGWVFHQNRELWSKMDTQSLRTLSKGATQGMFFPVGTASFDLGKIMTKLREVWPGESHHKGHSLQYQEGYGYCLFIALIALLLCFFVRKRALYTGLAILTLTSQAQAFNQNPPTDEHLHSEQKIQVKSRLETHSVDSHSHADTDENSSAENIEKAEDAEDVIDTSAAYLQQYSLNQQFEYATSLFEQFPGASAEVYRYISEQTSSVEVAVSANYNLATSLISYAQLLNEEMAALATNGDIDELLSLSLEDEDFIDPEPIFEEATDILRLVLQQAPNHQNSANNLEWLTYRLNDKSKSQKPQQSQQQSHQQEQDQDAQEQESDSKEQQQKSEQESESSDDNSEAEQQEQQPGDIDVESLTLPPPSASAEEIMQQAKQRDQQNRSQARKKQSPVERDW